MNENRDLLTRKLALTPALSPRRGGRCKQGRFAVHDCGLGGQAERLVKGYLRLAEEGASSVVLSQTLAEVRHVNEDVRAQATRSSPDPRT